jgi:hypothetical protein
MSSLEGKRQSNGRHAKLFSMTGVKRQSILDVELDYWRVRHFFHSIVNLFLC